MANYQNIIAAIESVIKQNGNQEITGQILQQSLVSIIHSLGAQYQFAGFADSETNPGTPDHNVAYLAGPGTYPNFNAYVVPAGFIAAFLYNGNWDVKFIEFGGGGGGGTSFVPEPDDLTLSNSILKFANRSYNPQNPDGLGYFILRKNKTFAEQVTKSNTIYEIRYDFDLNNATFQIPENCVLYFIGGKIKNATIVGTKTTIQADNVQIFDNVAISGDFRTEFIAEWFLPEYDSTLDYTTLLADLFNCGAKEIKFTVPNVYKITSTVVIQNDVTIKADGRFLGFLASEHELPIIEAVGNITAIEYHHTDLQRKIQLGGLIIVSGDENVADYTTPIVYIEQEAGGWQGAKIDLYIRSRHKSTTYGGETYTYCGMVGIEINTVSGSFTLADIGGAIVCYKGLNIHGNYFVTDININGRIEACYGGEITGSFCYLRGHFQTLVFPNDIPAIRPSECFFYGGLKWVQESTVWDVDSKIGSLLSSVRYPCNNAMYALQNTKIDGDNIPNYPSLQTASFVNSNFGDFHTIDDLIQLNIECSQDDFNTILFTNNDFMGLKSLFQNFRHLSGYTNTTNDELANMTPFLKTSILQNSTADTTKPLQIRITIRYNKAEEHWLRIYSWNTLQTSVVRKVYTDSGFTNLIATEEHNPTPFSGGNSKTQRAMFAHFRYYGDTTYNEVIINYEQNIYGTVFGNPTYHIVGFNVFTFQTEANKKVSLYTNRIYHDWEISTIGTRRLIVPLQLKTCNQGFVIVAPTTLATQMIIGISIFPADNLSDFSSRIVRGGFVILNTNGTAKISGISSGANVYKSDYTVTGLSYYRIYIPNCFCRVEYIFGRGVQLEDFVASGGSSIGQSQTTLTIERNYVVSVNTNRPTLAANDAGYQYFDTTLKHPIWWDGTQWVDASGNAIS